MSAALEQQKPDSGDLAASTVSVPSAYENQAQRPMDALLQAAYADGRADEAEALAHRGYALMGAGAYILTVCDGDERGPELVISLATDEERAARTVGDLRDVVRGQEIPLERTAIRLQFASIAGLDAVEQQLRFLREELQARSASDADARTPAQSSTVECAALPASSQSNEQGGAS